MENQKESSNDNSRFLVESVKTDNPKIINSFPRENNEESNELINTKELNNQGPPQTYYDEIMNSRCSSSKVIISTIIILSIICIEYQILQVALIFNFNLLINKVELISFNSLIFIAYAASWVTKNYLIQYYQRYSILIFSVISVILIFFIVITRSSYILFLCYPFVSLCLGLIYFNAEQMYEDYFQSNNIRLSDNLFFATTKYGSLFILLFIWISSKNYFSLWFISYIVLGCLIIIIWILTYLIKSSPICLYKEMKKKTDNQDLEKEVLPLIEEIKGVSAEKINKEVLLDELYENSENQNINQIWNVFYEYQEKDTQKLSVSVILLFIINFCNCYNNTGLILGLPMWIHENPPVGQERMDYYFKMLAIVFSISSFGGFVASLFIWLLGNSKKSLLGLLNFFCSFSFLLVMTIVPKLIPYFGACSLLFEISNMFYIKNYVYKAYDKNTCYKNLKLLQFTFYIGSALSAILFIIFFKISPTFGFSSLIVMSAIGAFCNLFLSD